MRVEDEDAKEFKRILDKYLIDYRIFKNYGYEDFLLIEQLHPTQEKYKRSMARFLLTGMGLSGLLTVIVPSLFFLTLVLIIIFGYLAMSYELDANKIRQYRLRKGII